MKREEKEEIAKRFDKKTEIKFKREEEKGKEKERKSHKRARENTIT